ncbi:MAG: ABC transporter ATP-binding protein [Anaerolinea sp.]|nr:ABC transporter ATP-binding protein [Anaerolinea sp.]
MTPLIQVDRLCIGYRNASGERLHVLRDVSLNVHRGETIGIVGESGCGKSTLTLALMGYLRRGSEVISGAVRLGSDDLFALDEAALARIRGKRIAVVPQNAGQALTPSIRVGTQIAEAIQLHTTTSREAVPRRVMDLLTQVNLPDPPSIARRYPHQLSGGQQQRVAIAMALASEPEVLLLDEPTTGLDVTTQAAILGLLMELQRTTGVAMICVSHDIGVIARLTQFVAVMYAGEIVEYGRTQAVLRQPLHPYTRGLLASMPSIHASFIPCGIPGRPPVIRDGAAGCAFAERCAFADDLCASEHPVLMAAEQRDTTHLARCLHIDWVAASTPAARMDRAAASVKIDRQKPLLELHNVSITYQRSNLLSQVARVFGVNDRLRPVVEGISFAVHRGETVALVGESGSGKSTIVRTIIGIHPPVSGTIQFDGSPLARHAHERPLDQRRRVQIVFQNPDASLNPRQSVEEILAQPLRLYFRLGPRNCRERAAALLEQVRLSARYLTRYPAQLSGGEKQRIAIARAFAAEPDIILCDEITSALDVSVQAAVLELLTELQRERHTAYVFIAHDLAVVRAIADHVIVMHRGRICEMGVVHEIYSPPHHPYTETLLSAARAIHLDGRSVEHPIFTST